MDDDVRRTANHCYTIGSPCESTAQVSEKETEYIKVFDTSFETVCVIVRIKKYKKYCEH